MSIKGIFVEDVMLQLSFSFDQEQLQMIRKALISNLGRYDLKEIMAEDYALATVDEFNDRLLKRFLVKKSLSGISNSSIKQYAFYTRRFLIEIDKKATEITTEEIEYYLISYKARNGISNTSLTNMICGINNFFQFLVDEEIIARNPIAKLPKIKKDTIPEPIFSKKQEESLYLACDNLRDRAILEFFFATGCRVQEVCNVKISDIDLKTNAISIIGKGNKLRTVYTNEKALLHVERYLEEREEVSEYLFVTRIKPVRNLSPDAIQTMMKKVGEKAQVEGVHPHRFRATFCTRLIDRGISLHVVQKLMGHNSIETTMRYYRGTGNLKSEYDKFSA